MTGSPDAGPDALALMRPEIVAARVERVTITRPAWLLTQWQLARSMSDGLQALSREWSNAEDACHRDACDSANDARVELRAWLASLGIDPAALAECVG